VKRLAAFLPPLVSALRRSKAASRLELLAMSARRLERLIGKQRQRVQQTHRRLGSGLERVLLI
jgi:hypothetical protein